MSPEDYFDSDDFEGLSARVNALAMEALQELWRRLPYGTEIVLADGSVPTFKKFSEPQVMQRPAGHEDWLHGKLLAGVDVKAKDASWHIEFLVVKTGWGGMPLPPPGEESER